MTDPNSPTAASAVEWPGKGGVRQTAVQEVEDIRPGDGGLSTAEGESEK